MAKANKLVPVVDGTAGTPIELQDSRIYTNAPTDGDLLVYNANNTRFEAEHLSALVSDVALTGDYNDLDNKPTNQTIRTINHEQITDSSLGDINIHDGFYFPNAVQDNDGNWYGAVVIGEQVWFAENLRTTTYANGESIEQLSNPNPAANTEYLINSGYYYINQQVDEKKYGYYYNYSAIMHGAASSNANPSGVQGIAPTGWHIPSKAEWLQLKSYISKQTRYILDNNDTYIAKALASSAYWISDDTNYNPGKNQGDNNATGLNFVPAGIIHDSNAINNDFWAGTTAALCSTTQSSDTTYVVFRLNNNQSDFFEHSYSKHIGVSVRCVSDLTPVQFRNWYVQQFGSMQHHLENNSSETYVQSDWNQTDSTADDFIKNKPTIPTLPTIDTALSETSTNPVQNKAINILTRKLWQRVDIISRLGSEYPAANKQISSGSWSSSSGSAYKHWAVPVDGMRTVSVTSNSSQYAILTFLKTYNSTTGTPDFATGYTGNSTVNTGKTRIFNVPEDANWLIVMTGNNGARKPDHIYLTGVAANHPQLTYVQLASGATTCYISLTDTKQSFVIDNSANSSSIPITVTNQFNNIYSNENISISKNRVVQFDFESVESEQKTLLFVKQTTMYDRT